MLLLGRDFDRSEEPSWAAALLAREDPGPSAELEEPGGGPVASAGASRAGSTDP